MAKNSKKVLGFLVALCMLASMFTCLISMPVSAEAADMLSFDGTNAYGCVAYTTSWATIPAGDYRFEMDCKITSGTPVCYPCGRNYNTDMDKFSNQTYTYDETNRKYIVTFTVTSDIEGNFSMYIGNYDGALGGSGDAVFSCANPKLYSIDGSGNATENTSIIKYDFNTYTNTKDISSSTTHKWRLLSKSGVTRSAIPDGYFDPVTTGGGDYTGGEVDPQPTTSKMIRVDNYKEGANPVCAGYVTEMWRPLEETDIVKPNTKYRVSFNWETIAGPAIDSGLLLWVNYFNGEKWNELFRSNDLTKGAATDKALYKTDLNHGQRIDIDFTTPADCADGGSINFLFGDINWAYQGNLDARMAFYIADLRIYTRDDSDNLTAIPITDIAANEELGEFEKTQSVTYAAGQVHERNTTKGYVTFEDIPDGYFDEPGEPSCTHENQTVVPAVASTCKTHGHGEYTVCDDCGEILSGSDEELPLDPDNHEGETEVRGAIPATETTDGYTGDTYCLACGAKIADGEVIPATGGEPPVYYVPGDINGDAEVDNKDLIRLFQYLSEWEVDVNVDALDVNGDDSVDNKDLIRLFQYLSEWEVDIF